MVKAISGFFPVSVHATSPFRCVQKTLNAITQFVLKVLRNIRELFQTQAEADRKKLLAFYRGDKPNDHGVTLQRIIKADDKWLEKNHHWIQWAFPLKTKSKHNPQAPVLDDETIRLLRSDPKVFYDDVFIRMMEFYGLDMNNDLKIVRGPTFQEQQKLWLYPKSHHFKRITRILQSLEYFECPTDPNRLQFFRIMEDIYHNEGKDIIPKKSYEYWKGTIPKEVLLKN
jgi:Opioid growth factor receptor (OGFr) conserved region